MSKITTKQVKNYYKQNSHKTSDIKGFRILTLKFTLIYSYASGRGAAPPAPSVQHRRRRQPPPLDEREEVLHGNPRRGCRSAVVLESLDRLGANPTRPEEMSLRDIFAEVRRALQLVSVPTSSELCCRSSRHDEVSRFAPSGRPRSGLTLTRDEPRTLLLEEGKDCKAFPSCPAASVKMGCRGLCSLLGCGTKPRINEVQRA